MKRNDKNVFVVGSGLSAYGAIIAALDSNFKVTVLDTGSLLPDSIASKISGIDKTSPMAVHSDIFRISNESHKHKLGSKNLPKKTVFGSKYFYQEEALEDSNKLPFSEAMGGYSVAWGAAVLPPRLEDLPNLPFEYEDLLDSIEILARYLPLPYFEDDLTPYFPNFGIGVRNGNVKLSPSQKSLLQNLLKLDDSSKEQVCMVGQSRLLTTTSGKSGCQYCGMCSHGCIYASIFSTEKAILDLILIGKIDYLPQHRVISVSETDNNVSIYATNMESGLSKRFLADHVFIAAGAVNSTKIAVESYRLQNEEIKIQKTGGFVRPYFSIKKNGFDWPIQNTQANAFMEIRDTQLSNFWIHSQISVPNEIVILGLGHLSGSLFSRFVARPRRFFLSHLVLVMTNLHSSTGPFYRLSTVSTDEGLKFVGKLEIPQEYRRHENKVDRYLRNKFLKIGLIAIPFAKKGVSNGPGYHIGGSIPMGQSGHLATDCLGRFPGARNILFVDTSVLPCIPATTIGLLAMSNAHRIVSKFLSPQFSE